MFHLLHFSAYQDGVEIDEYWRFTRRQHLELVFVIYLLTGLTLTATPGAQQFCQGLGRMGSLI